jgi:imidazole glycerol-phosphate synthase subunit HisH
VIAIVNYGAGNIASVKRAVEYLGYACTVTSDPGLIERSDRFIVPGVGNFQATTVLSTNVLGTALARQISLGRPLLGICLGMQWLFHSSDEAPGILGLGAFAGRCHSLPVRVKSPHVGWDQLEIRRQTRLLRGTGSGGFVYFTHRYCAPVMEATVATCDYGAPFSAAVEDGNLFGVQFHPEKSGGMGLAVLENFCTC